MKIAEDLIKRGRVNWKPLLGFELAPALPPLFRLVIVSFKKTFDRDLARNVVITETGPLRVGGRSVSADCCGVQN